MLTCLGGGEIALDRVEDRADLGAKRAQGDDADDRDQDDDQGILDQPLALLLLLVGHAEPILHEQHRVVECQHYVVVPPSRVLWAPTSVVYRASLAQS